MVLVDTSIWSAALRRNKPLSTTEAKAKSLLTNLIEHGRAAITGPIRQELLSGLKHEEQFKALSSRLAAFPDLPIETKHWVAAAGMFNSCRNRGIQGSHIDFLICAVAKENNLPIATLDEDFASYAPILGLSLVQISANSTTDG